MKPGRMRGLLVRVRVRGAGAVLSTVAGPLLEHAANIGVGFGVLPSLAAPAI